MEGNIRTSALDDQYSHMSWEVAALGKSGREIASLHEAWAEVQSARGAFDRAQEHLDNALEIWKGYDEPSLTARTLCLKGLYNGKSNDFTAAAGSFKRAQRLAEEIADVPLLLCVLANRAICEIQRGEAKAAATRARRTFVKAEAEGDSDMIMAAHCVRASSYQTSGNFLAACNEHEAAAKLVSDGKVQPPTPALALAMDANFGICVLRTGKSQRAALLFERALATARNALGGEPPIVLARCLYHAGEAARQAGDLNIAWEHLEEAAGLIATERAATTDNGKGEGRRRRSDWAGLALEVANSRGLCTLLASTRNFDGSRPSMMREDQPHPGARKKTGSVDDETPPLDKSARMPDDEGQDGNDVKEARAKERQGTEGSSAAKAAATLILEGAEGWEEGGHPAQEANNAILEGVAWSLAGRGNTEGVAALKRAERIVEKMLASSSSTPDLPSPAALTSAAVGEHAPAGSENEAQLTKLQIGVLCDCGIAARGGVGLGVAFSTSVSGAGGGRASSSAWSGNAAGALAAVAATRAAAKAANAGWRDASQLVKKQTSHAAKAATDSARQLSLAHAHAGAIELITGKPEEAAVLFDRQLQEARKVGDPLLEALAERNLADAREGESDLPGTLRHLRRCRDLSRNARNLALETDTYRRLSGIYALIAGPADAGAAVREPGEEWETNEAELTGGEEGVTEAEIEEKEDMDLRILQATASERARLFAERYENAVAGLSWPIGGGTTMRPTEEPDGACGGGEMTAA